jgi:hypothetical protein
MDPWVDESGDDLDHQLHDAVLWSVSYTSEWMPSDEEQWTWRRLHPDQLMFTIDKAREEWHESQRGEREAREAVAMLCNEMVTAGERGTHGRHRHATLALQERQDGMPRQTSSWA